MNQLSKELLEITAPFINDETDEKFLAEASLKYRNLLLVQTEIDRGNPINEEHIQGRNGKAVSLNTAVDCLDDHNRTKTFILGTYKAIQSLLKKGKKEIHILYAGTGPFAAILLPSMLRLQGERINYTLLDINSTTLTGLRLLLDKLDLKMNLIEIVRADATTYEIDANKGYDIIISETMQAALAREQQVSVFLNLMKQSHEDVVFIPEKIEVLLGIRSMGLSNYELTKENCTELDPVFEVSKEAMRNKLRKNELPTAFPKTSSSIEKNALIDKDLLLLITKIKVFDDQVLDIQESGLTMPLIIDNISMKGEQDLSVDVQYVISEEPKFEFEIK
ncbi:MAG: hypothetical protein R8G66_19785 [Cytophagales bacterium]|nr:hypothetical protein [Cytophagales bacterium]